MAIQNACDMRSDCINTVTHVGNKGYIYCSSHAAARAGVEKTRELKKIELEHLHEGLPIGFTPKKNFRAWVRTRSGELVVEYKETALAAKRAYNKLTAYNDYTEAGWETRDRWLHSRGDAGVVWAD